IKVWAHVESNVRPYISSLFQTEVKIDFRTIVESNFIVVAQTGHGPLPRNDSSSGTLSSNVTFVTCKSLVLRICDDGANQLSEEIAHSSDATGRAHGYVLRGRATPHTPADADESAEQRFGRGFSAMVSTVPSPSSSGVTPGLLLLSFLLIQNCTGTS